MRATRPGALGGDAFSCRTAPATPHRPSGPTTTALRGCERTVPTPRPSTPYTRPSNPGLPRQSPDSGRSSLGPDRPWRRRSTGPSSPRRFGFRPPTVRKTTRNRTPETSRPNQISGASANCRDKTRQLQAATFGNARPFAAGRFFPGYFPYIPFSFRPLACTAIRLPTHRRLPSTLGQCENAWVWAHRQGPVRRGPRSIRLPRVFCPPPARPPFTACGRRSRDLVREWIMETGVPKELTSDESADPFASCVPRCRCAWKSRRRAASLSVEIGTISLGSRTANPVPHTPRRLGA